jgi:hypothetical protein
VPGGRHPVVEHLGRAGLVARGIVYGLIGVLSLEVALRVGGKTASQRGALETIVHEPLGGGLLVIVAIGLAGYGIWQLAIAITGPSCGDDGALERASAAAGGLAYLALCATAVEILGGSSAAGSSNSPKHQTAGVLSSGAGQLLVGIVGAIFVGVALYQAYVGITRKFLEDSRTGEMNREARRVFTWLAAFGHGARAVIFALIGYGLLRAAIDYAPRSAVGLDGALANLGHAAGGRLLLGAVAIGLIAFGLYSIADGRYHRI